MPIAAATKSLPVIGRGYGATVTAQILATKIHEVLSLRPQGPSLTPRLRLDHLAMRSAGSVFEKTSGFVTLLVLVLASMKGIKPAVYLRS